MQKLGNIIYVTMDNKTSRTGIFDLFSFIHHMKAE